MAIAKKLMTASEFEDFIALPENADRLLELVDGEVVEKVPSELDGLIVSTFHALLWQFTKPRKLGRIVIEVRYNLPDDQHNTRIPDIAFTRTERLLPVVEKGAAPQLPDLAIEVQSPDNTLRAMREKAEYFLKNGVRMVVLVITKKKRVEVYVGDADPEILALEDTLSFGDVIPDFSIPVSAIFEE